MKKWLASLAVTLAGFLGLSASALAATTPGVSGIVTFNSTPAASASVEVLCAVSGGQHVRNLTTSSTGHFTASFGVGQCNDGAEVTVIASSSDGLESGQATGVMGDGGISQRVEIDIGLVTTTPLPEFIPATAALALVAAVGIVIVVRRRKELG